MKSDYVIGRAVEISLTHSGNWVACSFGSEPNGVDVETDATDALEIAEHFFTAAEFETLSALTGAASAVSQAIFVLKIPLLRLRTVLIKFSLALKVMPTT